MIVVFEIIGLKVIIFTRSFSIVEKMIGKEKARKQSGDQEKNIITLCVKLFVRITSFC